MSLEPCFERSNGLRNPHLNLISDAGNFWPWKCLKSTAACQGHAATGPQHDFIFKHWRFKRRHRVIFKSLIHDCPCSRQTRTRSRNSYTKSQERPTNQPTNQPTSKLALTSQLASLTGRQYKPQPMTSKYIKNLLLYLKTISVTVS